MVLGRDLSFHLDVRRGGAKTHGWQRQAGKEDRKVDEDVTEDMRRFPSWARES